MFNTMNCVPVLHETRTLCVSKTICSYWSLLVSVSVRTGSGRCVRRQYFLSWSVCCRTKTSRFRPTLQESSCTLWSSPQVQTHTCSRLTAAERLISGSRRCCFFLLISFMLLRTETLLNDKTVTQIHVLTSSLNYLHFVSDKSFLFVSLVLVLNTTIPMSLSCCCYREEAKEQNLSPWLLN